MRRPAQWNYIDAVVRAAKQIHAAQGTYINVNRANVYNMYIWYALKVVEVSDGTRCS